MEKKILSACGMFVLTAVLLCAQPARFVEEGWGVPPAGDGQTYPETEMGEITKVAFVAQTALPETTGASKLYSFRILIQDYAYQFSIGLLVVAGVMFFFNKPMMVVSALVGIAIIWIGPYVGDGIKTFLR